jgi:hypothetical protein
MAPVVVAKRTRAVPAPIFPPAREPTMFSRLWSIPGKSLEKLPTTLWASRLALLSRASHNVTVPVVAR